MFTEKTFHIFHSFNNFIHISIQNQKLYVKNSREERLLFPNRKICESSCLFTLFTRANFFYALCRKKIAFFARGGYNTRMDNVISALDEYFCAHYSDYVRISALEGYSMPNVVYVASDGNIARRDSSCMRLCHQADPNALLKRLKSSLADTSFTFSYFFPRARDKRRLKHSKTSFAKLLPELLRRSGESVESVGEKLDIEPRFWNMILKGKLFPEKNTVIAVCLIGRLSPTDAAQLFTVSGFVFTDDDVRDVVVRYLLEQRIFQEEIRDRCLAEYSITNLPIKK